MTITFDKIEIKDGLLLRAFVISMALFAFTLPIIHADFLFKDDLMRSVENWNLSTWLNDGRYGGLLVMGALGFCHLSDIAPLPQLLWIPPLAFVLSAISLRFQFSFFLSVFAFSFVAIHPFFLENLSFRYESLTMGLAVSLALMPFAVPAFFQNDKIDQKSFIYSYNVLFPFLALNFYQPGVNLYGAFICFFALVSLFRLEELQEILRILSLRIASLLSALILYFVETKFVNLLPIGRLDPDSYGERHALLTFDPHIILSNLADFWELLSLGIAQGTQGSFLGFCLLLGFLFLLKNIFVGMKKKETPQRSEQIFRFGLAIAMVLGIFFFLLGPQILLASPVYQPRTLIGFGGIAAILLCFLCGITSKDDHLKKLRYGLCCTAFLSEILLSFSYANAMKAQFEQNDYIVSQMVEDAIKFKALGARYWTTHGPEPLALRAVRTFRNFPVTRRMLLSDGLEGKWEEVYVGDNIDKVWRYLPQKNYDVDWDISVNRYWVYPEYLSEVIRSRGNFPENLSVGWKDANRPANERPIQTYTERGLGKSFFNCTIDTSVEHAFYEADLIGVNLVFDYTKSCSSQKKQ
ncbi:hypothetical protein FAI40_06795 [Acetobacteraceae bacterium]|nr:hypothetical protein FAI40_06795 [Acetobacteraceae bacterium]